MSLSLTRIIVLCPYARHNIGSTWKTHHDITEIFLIGLKKDQIKQKSSYLATKMTTIDHRSDS